MNFKEFIRELVEKDIMKRVKKEVKVQYEISAILNMLEDTPVIFENVKGSNYTVIGNICSTRDLIALGLGVSRDRIIPTILQGLDYPAEPEIISAKDYIEVDPDIGNIPVLTYFANDGGPYITSGIVVANDAEYGINCSFHRAMVINKNEMVFRICERDFFTYLSRGLREFAFCIGNSVSVLISSAVSTDINVNELSVANAMDKIKVIEIDGHKVPEAEIVMIMEMTGEMHNEGPFLDLTKTHDIVRKQRVAKIKKLFLKEGAIFHGLLPGGSEHRILMGMPREATIYREVSKVCNIKDIVLTPGGCSWLNGAISIYKQDHIDVKDAIMAAFKGHGSMKHLFVVDDDIDIHDPIQIEWALATRFQGCKDMIIFNEKGSSLDPSSNKETGMTTKIGFDLTIPGGSDSKYFKKPDPPMKINLKDYF